MSNYTRTLRTGDPAQGFFHIEGWWHRGLRRARPGHHQHRRRADDPLLGSGERSRARFLAEEGIEGPVRSATTPGWPADGVPRLVKGQPGPSAVCMTTLSRAPDVRRASRSNRPGDGSGNIVTSGGTVDPDQEGHLDRLLDLKLRLARNASASPI